MVGVCDVAIAPMMVAMEVFLCCWLRALQLRGFFENHAPNAIVESPARLEQMSIHPPR
jgi:hypothetical protein